MPVSPSRLILDRGFWIVLVFPGECILDRVLVILGASGNVCEGPWIFSHRDRGFFFRVPWIFLPGTVDFSPGDRGFFSKGPWIFLPGPWIFCQGPWIFRLGPWIFRLGPWICCQGPWIFRLRPWIFRPGTPLSDRGFFS